MPGARTARSRAYSGPSINSRPIATAISIRLKFSACGRRSSGGVREPTHRTCINKCRSCRRNRVDAHVKMARERSLHMARQISLLLMAVTLVLPAISRAQGTASFSGTWKLAQIDPPVDPRNGRPPTAGGGLGGGGDADNAY